jgi:peroxiredoxin
VAVVAISPDPPEAAAKLKQAMGDPPFLLLSDPDQKVRPLCGVNHCVVLLDGAGAIRWGALDENWRTIRLASVVQAAYRLGEGREAK